MTHFLFGIRGTEKTLWVKEHLPQAHWFNLLDERLYQSFLLDAGLFGAELRKFQAGSWIVIDEVQRLPNLLNEVHNAIEERGLRFARIGSSARKLRRAGINLLGGRAFCHYLHPLLPAELGHDFDCDRQLRFGSLALVLGDKSPIDTGVMRAAKKQLTPPGLEESRVLFEGFVALLLRAYKELGLMKYDQLYYWAAVDAKAEVDFLIDRNGAFTALEAKSVSRLTTVHFCGLRTIIALKGLTRRILVYRGERTLLPRTA